MLGKLGFVAIITCAIVSVVLSTNLAVVVRQLNPDTTRPPLADSFSNRQCSSSSCPSRSTCAGAGQCCMCQCLYDWPNVFVNRTSLKCTNYGELNRMSSAYCQYSFRRPNEPLEVLSLTEEANGKIRFRNDSARVNCTENGLSVDVWQFLNVNGRWQNGVGNVFSVDSRTVGGRDGNKKDLTFLNWNTKLDAKYAGLLIKLSLVCGSRNVGCILAKINGTYTYDTLQFTTSAPASTSTSQQPTTQILSTPVPEETTPSPSPSSEPESTGATTTGPTPSPSQGTTTVKPIVSDIPGTTYSRTTGKVPTNSAGEQKASDEQKAVNNGSSNTVKSTAIGPILGIVGGLIGLICLVCLIGVLYKKRKRWSEKPAKDPEVDSGAALEDYQDPVYAELPDDIQTAGDCDNPTYCDPTEEQIIIRSKRDPLPALPLDESTYQPLDQNTRIVSGAPVLPPVSYPEESTDYLNPDGEDYLNPDGEEPDTVDYDNPPVTNQVQLNSESSDYDNPPIQFNSPGISTQRIEDLNNESPDYDNPPVEDIPPSAPSESVPESTEGAVNEYFELEPEDSSL